MPSKPPIFRPAHMGTVEQGRHGSGGAWRSWYKTPRWQELRLKVFLRDHLTCANCGHLETHPVCDHIKPHRGDELLFWDEANLQTLCKVCHDTVKQAEEQQSKHQRGVWH